MTLLAEIQAAFPALTAANRDDGAIATALSAGRTKVDTRMCSIGTVLNALGPTSGAALLDSLQSMATTNSAVKWALVMVEAGTLDLGLDSTRSMITALVPEPAKSILLNLAVVPDPVSVDDVSKALEGVAL